MTLNRVYEPARRCTGEVTAGARALMAYYLAVHGHVGGRNLGIYNCKPIAGSAILSLHGEGRACDLGVPDGDPGWARQLADAMVMMSAELGIQLVIYRRQVWSSVQATAGWRAYHGTNPHNDHMHVELTWAGARSLTVGAITLALSAGTGLPRPAPNGPTWTETMIMQLPTLRRGATGRPVKKAQALANLWGVSIKEDGVFGENTERGIRRVQAATGCTNDGVIGEQTWTALLTS